MIDGTAWIALVIAALVVGIIAGHGIGENKGFRDGLETGVNLFAYVLNGKKIEIDEDDDE